MTLRLGGCKQRNSVNAVINLEPTISDNSCYYYTYTIVQCIQTVNVSIDYLMAKEVLSNSPVGGVVTGDEGQNQECLIYSFDTVSLHTHTHPGTSG